MKKRESICVDLQLLKGRFIGYTEDALVFLLDLFDVGVFLDALNIILLPFAKRLDTRAL